MKRIVGTDQFEPGIIYELRCCIDNEWHAFYVGETINAASRKSQHSVAGKSNTRLVYQFIRESLEPNNIAWDLFPVEQYGSEGPTDLEHEHIMGLLHDGVRLRNMKKGSDVWMQNQIAIATDMHTRGIRSYRKYQHTLSLEAQERTAAAKQVKWMADQYRSQIIQDIEQQRMIKNAQVEEIKKYKIEREAKKAVDLAEIRARQQATWEAERARQIETDDRERARQRKETLAQTLATDAEKAIQTAVATAREAAFAKEWPEHKARLDERERLIIDAKQNTRELNRYMREKELERLQK